MGEKKNKMANNKYKDMDKHRKIVRESNKKRYHSDANYKEYQLNKSKICIEARTELVRRHKEEYQDILIKLAKRYEKDTGKSWLRGKNS